MSALIIVQARIEDEGLLAEYARLAGPTLAEFGAERVAATNDAEVVEGEPIGTRAVVLRFPDRDAARSWYHSDAYQVASEVRRRATTSSMVLVDEV